MIARSSSQEPQRAELVISLLLFQVFAGSRRIFGAKFVGFDLDYLDFISGSEVPFMEDAALTVSLTSVFLEYWFDPNCGVDSMP